MRSVLLLFLVVALCRCVRHRRHAQSSRSTSSSNSNLRLHVTLMPLESCNLNEFASAAGETTAIDGAKMPNQIDPRHCRVIELTPLSTSVPEMQARGCNKRPLTSEELSIVLSYVGIFTIAMLLSISSDSRARFFAFELQFDQYTMAGKLAANLLTSAAIVLTKYIVSMRMDQTDHALNKTKAGIVALWYLAMQYILRKLVGAFATDNVTDESIVMFTIRAAAYWISMGVIFGPAVLSLLRI